MQRLTRVLDTVGDALNLIASALSVYASYKYLRQLSV